MAATPGLEIGFTDSTNYTTAWLNADRLHYNQTGLNNMGRLFAEYIAADMGFTDPGAVPPSPASRTSQVGSLASGRVGRAATASSASRAAPRVAGRTPSSTRSR